MLPNMLITVFIGLGIYFIHQIIPRRKISYWINGAIFMALILMTVFNLPRVSQRNNYLDYNFGYNTLISVEKKWITTYFWRCYHFFTLLFTGRRKCKT
jgi:hypothetical protein